MSGFLNPGLKKRELEKWTLRIACEQSHEVRSSNSMSILRRRGMTNARTPVELSIRMLYSMYVCNCRSLIKRINVRFWWNNVQRFFLFCQALVKRNRDMRPWLKIVPWQLQYNYNSISSSRRRCDLQLNTYFVLSKI